MYDKLIFLPLLICYAESNTIVIYFYVMYLVYVFIFVYSFCVHVVSFLILLKLGFEIIIIDAFPSISSVCDSWCHIVYVACCYILSTTKFFMYTWPLCSRCICCCEGEVYCIWVQYRMRYSCWSIIVWGIYVVLSCCLS